MSPNSRLIRLLFEEVWNQKKTKLCDQIFHKDLILNHGPRQLQGREALKGLIAHWLQAFPDIHHVIEEELYIEDKAVVRWRGEGTHLGIFNGLLPTGRKMHYSGITIFQAEGAVFREIWLSPDLVSLFDSLKVYSEKIYTHKDFCEDFSGPNRLMNEWVWNARPVPSCRQKIANSLREQFATVPVDGKPEIIIPHELMTEVAVEESRISAKERSIRTWIYTPKTKKQLPMVLYIHGGGWIAGSTEGSDIIARNLALLGECVVVSIDYRLAPEFPYPDGLNDCIDVYKWARGKSEKVVVAGEASGGTLALGVVLKLLDEGVQIPDGALTLCSVCDLFFEKYPSFLKYAPQGLFFDSSFASYARSVYAPFEKWKDPYVSPIYGDLKDFCPTFMLSAGLDPFVDDNNAFVKKLRDANVSVEQLTHPKMSHGYYFFPGFTREEKEAYQAMGNFLKKVLMT